MVDLDYTLVVSGIGRVLSEIRRELARIAGVSEDYVYSLWLGVEAEYVALSSPRAFDWSYVVDKVCSILGISCSFDVVKMVRYGCRDVKVLDDAHRVLEDLKSMGYTLVLATNGLSVYQLCVVSAAGFDRYFDYMVFSDSVGCLKNCREYYRQFESMGTIVVVGDSYFFDVYYPKLFGYKSVFVYRGYVEDIFAKIFELDTKIQPDATIDNLQKLPQTLQKMFKDLESK